MQSGYGNDVPDPAYFEIRIDIIADIRIVTQKKCFGKGSSIRREAIRKDAPNLFCDHRRINTKRFLRRLNMGYGVGGITQQQDPLSLMIGGFFCADLPGVAKLKSSPNLVPWLNTQFLIDVKSNVIFLLIQKNIPIHPSAPVRIVAIIPRCYGYLGFDAVLCLSRCKIVMLIEGKPG